MRGAAIIVPLLAGCLLEFDPDLLSTDGPTGCFGEAPPDASEIARKASALEPREWREIMTNGFDDALLEVADARTVLDSGDSGVWDPMTRTVRLLGGDTVRFVLYDEDSNEWSIEPDPPFAGQTSGEANDSTAFDPVSGTMFFRPLDGSVVHTFDTRVRTWSTLAEFSDNVACCGALAWFPEADTLVHYDGSIGLQRYNFEFSRWERIEGDYPSGAYLNFAEYSPVHRVVLFGGGMENRTIYVLEADETVRAAAEAPVVISTYRANVTADPVSGDFIVIADPGSMHAYDPVDDEWTELEASPVIPRTAQQSTYQVMSVPIDTHCVLGYFAYEFNRSSVWLYRHE